MKTQHYLNEAELLQLIEAAENQASCCRAPAYLKEQILQKTAVCAPQPKPLSRFLFRAKITAATAAAIAILILTPKAGSLEPFFLLPPFGQEHSLLSGLFQKTNQFCNFISDTADSIILKEDIK